MSEMSAIKEEVVDEETVYEVYQLIKEEVKEEIKEERISSGNVLGQNVAVKKEIKEELPSVVLASEYGYPSVTLMNQFDVPPSVTLMEPNITDVGLQENNSNDLQGQTKPILLFCTLQADCSFETFSQSELSQHLEHHQMLFCCSFCSYKTVDRQTLAEHFCISAFSAHSEVDQQFPCSRRQCDYRASRKEHLKRHEQSVHLKVKPFSCSQCAYKASEKVNLMQHQRSVHLKEKPFSCPHCPYRTSNKWHLKQHEQSVHLKEKPFACPHCEYRASLKGSLKKHLLRLHSK